MFIHFPLLFYGIESCCSFKQWSKDTVCIIGIWQLLTPWTWNCRWNYNHTIGNHCLFHTNITMWCWQVEDDTNVEWRVSKKILSSGDLLTSHRDLSYLSSRVLGLHYIAVNGTISSLGWRPLRLRSHNTMPKHITVHPNSPSSDWPSICHLQMLRLHPPRRQRSAVKSGVRLCLCHFLHPAVLRVSG